MKTFPVEPVVRGLFDQSSWINRYTKRHQYQHIQMVNLLVFRMAILMVGTDRSSVAIRILHMNLKHRKSKRKRSELKVHLLFTL